MTAFPRRRKKLVIPVVVGGKQIKNHDPTKIKPTLVFEAIPTETQIQAGIVKLIRTVSDAIVFSVPNGGFRFRSEAERLKREGLTPGVPDLVVLYNGKSFFMEVKRPRTGRASDAQVAFHKSLAEQGFDVAVVHSQDEALACLTIWGIPTRALTSSPSWLRVKYPSLLQGKLPDVHWSSNLAKLKKSSERKTAATKHSF